MQVIDITEVLIPPERQRKTFDEKSIRDLANSIYSLELLHAPVFENDGRTLRAGERRVRAMTLLINEGKSFKYNGVFLPPGCIPFTRLSDLTPSELFEVELAENVERVDLPWQERAAALAQLEELYARSKAITGELATFKGFAEHLLGPDTPQAVSLSKRAPEILNIAKHLNDPEVAKAKTQKEAAAIVKRKQTALLEQELNRKLASAGFDPDSVNNPHALHRGSSFDIAPTLPPASFDLIITDPPYGIDMHTMTTQSGSSSGLVHDYTDDSDYAAKCVTLVAEEGMRLTRASAACYMFCDLRFFPRWRTIFEAHGWYVWPNPIIWNKSPTGSLLGEANGPRHVYETILYAIKGRRAVSMVGTDVISIPGPMHDKRHPAEKPVELYSTLLRWSAVPGDRVLDFFCGCGPIFPAARQHQCTATGIELSETHLIAAEARRNALTEIL